MPMRRTTGSLQQAFTLIELLVTLAILATLATLVVPMAQVQVQRAKEQDLRTALREIRQAIDSYHQASQEGRIRRLVGASGYPPSLEVLVEGEVDLLDPKGGKLYFLRRVPRNPMNPDSSVSAEQSWGLRSYRSEADDPREGEDVYDVVVDSDKLGLNGVPYRSW